MGGFAALIGGLGQGAQQYGNQVRGFLENRRTGMASQLIQEAGRTWDPEHRSNLVQGAADLLSGVPMNKALTPVLKSFQTHEQGTQWHAQLGQAIQQAMPQAGPSTPAPAVVGQSPGTTLPADITAALPPTSPVAPEAQGPGPAPAPFTQGLAPNSPLAPPPQEAPALTAAIGQPAQPAAATPQGPIPQAGAFGQPYDPVEYTRRIYGLLKDLPPGAREGLAQDALQGAEANRQLAIAYTQMGWRQQQAQPALAEIDQVLNNPDSSLLEKMAARSAKIQTHEWIAGGGAAPAFPLNASTMLRYMTNDVETVDISNWDPAVKAAIGAPENASGPYRIAVDHMTKRPVEAISEAPARAVLTAALDQNSGQIVTTVTTPQRPGQGPQRLEPTAGLTPIAPGFGGFMTGTTGTGQVGIIPKAALFGSPTGSQFQSGMLKQTPFWNPLMFPQEHPVMATVQGQGGTSQLVQVPTINQRLPIGAGGGTQPQQSGGAPPLPPGTPPLPPGTKVIGAKPQAPHQIMVSEQQLAQENRALSQIQYLRDHANVFAGLIDAGKIELGLKDGLVQNILTRAIDYTPEQAAVVQAFNSLGESVGILRNALGGGFRSHDAFLRLQATKGSVMQNPQLTLQILDNLGGEFRAQAVPLARSMGGQVYGLKNLPPVGSLPEDLGGAPQGKGSDLYRRLSDKYLKKK